MVRRPYFLILAYQHALLTLPSGGFLASIARLLPTPPPPSSLPRPIVLDTHARTPPSCKLLANYRAGIGARPIVVCPSPSTEDKSASTANDEAKSEEERKQALRDAGAQVLEVESNRKGRQSDFTR